MFFFFWSVTIIHVLGILSKRNKVRTIYRTEAKKNRKKKRRRSSRISLVIYDQFKNPFKQDFQLRFCWKTIYSVEKWRCYENALLICCFSLLKQRAVKGLAKVQKIGWMEEDRGCRKKVKWLSYTTKASLKARGRRETMNRLGDKISF